MKKKERFVSFKMKFENVNYSLDLFIDRWNSSWRFHYFDSVRDATVVFLGFVQWFSRNN